VLAPWTPSEHIAIVGTNLAMARLAGLAEFWLDKPVLAISTCI
jgi:maleate isomerase